MAFSLSFARGLRVLAWGAAVCVALPCAGADPYPKATPIRLIVPQQVGSSNDLISRVMAQRLGEALGQNIVVDNRAGAGGAIALEIGKNASPDGYTLITAATGSFVIAPHTYRKLTFRPLEDFAPISLFAVTQNMLIVNAKLGINSVKDLIERARAQPGKLNLASGATGSQSHLAGIMFAEAAHISIVHVPYKGAGSAVAAIMSGEADLMFPTVPAALGQVKEGLVKGLAVTGRGRSPSLPELPTLEEAGLPGLVTTGWVGLVAPRGVPEAVIARLHAALVEAAKKPATQTQIRNLGAEISTTSPAEFAGFLREEYSKYGKTIKAAGLTAN